MGSVNINNVPDYLKEHGLFCLWKYEQDKLGRKTKVPYNPHNPWFHAASTKPDTFIDYAGILEAWNKYSDQFNGIGVGVFGDVGAIDIDHCITGTGPTELAMDIVNSIRSYSEISPSGEGVRVFFRVPDNWKYDRAKYYINNRRASLEIYVPGMTNKFLTFTGNKIKGRDLEQRQNELTEIVEKYMARGADPRQDPKQEQDAAPDPDGPEPETVLSDNDLLERAAAAANGDLFRKLWSGDTSDYNSQSEADQALCNILAFWTGRDAGRINSLFMQSGLMRDKWKRADYRNGTINKAIRDCREIYSGSQTGSQEPSAKTAGRVLDVSGDPEQPAATAATAPAAEQSIELLSLDDVEEKEPEWLIEGWVPKQSVTLIGAEGGAGKTSTWCHIVAKISAGKTTMFDPGFTDRKPAKVMYFSSEDSADTIIKKKIRDQGGKMSNVLTLDYSDKRFNDITFSDNGLLEALLKRYRPVLCVFDPVQQFIPDRVKMAERNAMRRCLAPLKRLAEVYGTTFIIVCHANKRDGASGRKRLADSSDLWDFARSVIMLGLTDEGDIRYATQEKSNYSKLQNTIQYKITDSGVEYCGTTTLHDSDYVMRSLATKSQPSIQRQDAEQFIIEFLQHNGGSSEIKALTEAAQAADVSANALRNAKGALLKAGTVKRTCESQGKGKGSKWYLSLEHAELPDNIPDLFEDEEE